MSEHTDEPLGKVPERLYLIESGDGLVWCDDPDPDGENDVAIEYVKVGVWRKQVGLDEEAEQS